jgi:hypothetical protein
LTITAADFGGSFFLPPSWDRFPHSLGVQKCQNYCEIRAVKEASTLLGICGGKLWV